MVSIWPALNSGRPSTRMWPKRRAPVRLDRQDEGRGPGLVVDDDVDLADLGEGVAALAELDPQRRLACVTRAASTGSCAATANASRSAAASCARRLVEPRQPHLGEAVERPRLGLQRDREAAARRGVDRGA